MWPGQHDEGDEGGELPPMMPARQLFEDVGTHDPDEVGPREQPAKTADRVAAVACAQSGLETGGENMAPVGQIARRGQPGAEGRHSGNRLQDIPWRDDHPNLMQPQPPPGPAGDVQMPRMGGIERPAQQADAHPAAIAKSRQRVPAEWAGAGGQGRTWPLPSTR